MEGLEVSESRLSELERTVRFDAEYFRPDFMRAAATVTAHKARQAVNYLAHVSDGNHFSISDDFIEEGLPYYRGQDVVGNFFVEHSSPVLISQKTFDQPHMRRSHLKKGDVLLSIVGTIGELSLVSSSSEATCSCKLAILRSKEIPPEYLATFLRSDYGRNQVQRIMRGAIQMSVLLEDMDQLQVMRFSSDFEAEIAKTVQAARVQFDIASESNQHAEITLLHALGLEGWQPPEPLTYTSSASEAFAANRIDSDFFAPARTAAIAALAALPHRLLKERCDSIREMFDPISPGEITEVRNFDITDALKPALDDSKEPVPVEELGSMKKLMKTGDLAVSRLRWYLKEIAVVRTTPEVPTVGSSEFIVLRPHAGVDPEVLMVFLRSFPVQTILKYCQEGNQHPRFHESNLLSIPVPDVLIENSAVITQHIRAAHTARHQARELLDRAKRAVEIAIEQGESAAMLWLTKHAG